MTSLPMIRNAAELTTPHEKIRSGFIELALEKSRRAEPFVEEAKTLHLLATAAKRPTELWAITEIRAGLLAAAGLSDKAQNHLSDADKKRAFEQLVKSFLIPAGGNFVEELVYRFLLTKGDSLGGKMRNLGGQIAKRKLTRSIMAALNLSGAAFCHQIRNSEEWLDSGYHAGNEEQIKAIMWTTNHGPRTLIYDLTIPITKTNVDLCLFSCRSEEARDSRFSARRHADKYLALGELKGGIDPAGADEHWKTARAALDRIRENFANSGNHPSTFFIGAAIERKMAEEIFQQLQTGQLAQAANLTHDIQLANICHWLISL